MAATNSNNHRQKKLNFTKRKNETQLEWHSVECMYLRQSCFDGWLNKTILKPRLAAASGRAKLLQYLYVGFSRRKIPRSLAYTIAEKQSGSGMRTMIRIGLKS